MAAPAGVVAALPRARETPDPTCWYPVIRSTLNGTVVVVVLVSVVVVATVVVHW